MKPKLTNADFCRASKQLRCEVAAIKAVADTESRGNGFYADGFPVILYERHIFRKYTDGKYSRDYPELSGPQGNYGKPGANQRRKFSAAFALDPVAAMKACSWGKFQLMGFNWKVCGFSSVGDMIDAMKESEGRHLDGFVSFVKGNRLDDEIREKDWAGFAYGYNGSGYKINKYDTKMATAYRRFAKENIDCSKDSAATPQNSNSAEPSDQITAANPVEPSEQPPIIHEGTVETTVIDGSPVVEKTTDTAGTVAMPIAATYKDVGLFAVLKKDFAAVGGGNLSFQLLQEYATQASGLPAWVISLIVKLATIAIVLGIAWLLFRFGHYVIWKIGEYGTRETVLKINADPTMKDVA